MTISKYFQLGGYAYLENISYRETKCIARLKVIHQFHQEDVYLACEAQGILEEYLLNLIQAVKKGDSVIVSFTAAYCRFKTAFSCPSLEGNRISEEQVVMLSCKLFSLGNCYINGSLADKAYFCHLVAA